MVLAAADAVCRRDGNPVYVVGRHANSFLLVGADSISVGGVVLLQRAESISTTVLVSAGSDRF